MSRLHTEKHLVSRIGWLRAAVLGANDGIVSTASLIVGVAAAAQGTSEILVAGIAGLVRGEKGMSPDEFTIAEALKSSGYVTGMFGKWHLGELPKFNPVQQGFDEYKGVLGGRIDYFTHQAAGKPHRLDWWNGVTGQGVSSGPCTSPGRTNATGHPCAPHVWAICSAWSFVCT